MSEIQFEVGDRVWSFSKREWGNVFQIDPNSTVNVHFESGYFWRPTSDLFFEEIPIPESARVRPKPKHRFTPGDPVCVRQRDTWYPRAFDSQRADGKFICRASSCPTEVGVWPECVPYDRILLGFDAVEEKNNE